MTLNKHYIPQTYGLRPQVTFHIFGGCLLLGVQKKTSSFKKYKQHFFQNDVVLFSIPVFAPFFSRPNFSIDTYFQNLLFLMLLFVDR